MAWADDIDAPGAQVRLTRSSQGADGVVTQAPRDLVERAGVIARGRGLRAPSLDEYTLARVIASEFGSGSPQELACIGDADLERARRRGSSVFDHATGGSGRYGSQSAPRPVATSRDPYVRQLRVVYALLATDGPRGIARGAVQYFDPRTQLALWHEGRAAHPLTILERWTYAKPWRRRTRDAEGRQLNELGAPGDVGDQLEWVGSVEGVNGWRLMLMRRRTSAEAQASAYAAARAVIESGGATQPAPAAASPERERVLLAAGAAVVAVGLKAI